MCGQGAACCSRVEPRWRAGRAWERRAAAGGAAAAAATYSRTAEAPAQQQHGSARPAHSPRMHTQRRTWPRPTCPPASTPLPTHPPAARSRSAPRRPRPTRRCRRRRPRPRAARRSRTCPRARARPAPSPPAAKVRRARSRRRGARGRRRGAPRERRCGRAGLLQRMSAGGMCGGACLRLANLRSPWLHASGPLRTAAAAGARVERSRLRDGGLTRPNAVPLTALRRTPCTLHSGTLLL